MAGGRLPLRPGVAGLRRRLDRPRVPIVQAMEDDQGAPDHLLEVTRGYFFNASVPVGVAESFVTKD